MPFTFAHAAAAAPIWYVLRKRLVLSALVIGCMSPDFEYFVQLKMRRTISHEWYGLVLLDLPLALGALWLLHRVLKRPLLLLLPERLAHLRSIGDGRFDFFPFGRFCKLCISILLGAASHVVWDSMTHINGWTVRHVAFFRRLLLAGTPLEKPVYTFLQNGCTVFGMAFLLLWVVHTLQRIPARPAQCVLPFKTRARVLLLLGACALAAGAANALAGNPFGSDPVALKQAVVHGLLGAVSGGALAMLVYAIFAIQPKYLDLTMTRAKPATRRASARRTPRP